MNRQILYFTEPYQVEVRSEPLPGLGHNQLLVETQYSAISAGSEMLLYQGLMPDDIALDETIDSLQGAITYPISYGYACVGKVIDVGSEVDKLWINRQIFAFYPHASHFAVDESAVIPIPDGVTAEDAVFLPNMETAVSFVMDSRPVIGEEVAVFGQGVVGLLTTALLAQLPLERLITIDAFPLRREQSISYGAHASFDPIDPTTLLYMRQNLVDLSFELSGNPEALNMAIETTGFDGRILIGSWYGQKPVSLNLGGKFHRNHLKLISSQVSHLQARWRGRWSKQRRLFTAWRMLEKIRPHDLITHRLPLSQAAEAYQLLAQNPRAAMQVVFTYEGN
ncbi:MAG: zinc-binding alcohol dehydrogenase [Anaerolineales bacterium]|nr:zinc-binding alcohol dehydrogenase [Anaerolineales bacterium]